jgi:hypothetical protein
MVEVNMLIDTYTKYLRIWKGAVTIRSHMKWQNKFLLGVTKVLLKTKVE